MDGVVTEHTMLIAEVQGNIENLIARVRRRNNEVFALQMEIMGLCHLVDQLLTQMTVLEGWRDSLIEILDSPVLILISSLAGHLLILIEDLNPEEGEEDEGVDLDEVFHPMPGEEYVEGETILDVLQRRNLRGDAVPEYEEALVYDDPGYILDH